MRFEFKLDMSGLKKQADAIVAAMKPALTEVGVKAQAAMVEGAKQYLDRPTEWTLRAFQSVVVAADELLVSVKPMQAEYLRYPILGGTRQAGDCATTALRSPSLRAWRRREWMAVTRTSSRSATSNAVRAGSLAQASSALSWSNVRGVGMPEVRAAGKQGVCRTGRLLVHAAS